MVVDHLGERAKDVVRIEQKHGSPVTRTGRWVVPQRVEVATKWVDVTLDLTEATITHGALQVDASMTGGNLTLVSRPPRRQPSVDLARAQANCALGSVKRRSMMPLVHVYSLGFLDRCLSSPTWLRWRNG